MNSFDFSAYDTEDVTPFIPETAENEEDSSVVEEFDFSTWDPSMNTANDRPTTAEQSALKDETYQKYYKTPDYTQEELAELSLDERMQLMKDQKVEREYLKSKGVSKGFLSGLTFGATGYADALKPQPHEYNAGIGELLGATPWIAASSGAASMVGKAGQAALGLEAAASTSKAVQAAQAAAHSFGTGSIYASGKEGVKAIAGDEVNFWNIPKTGAEFAIINGIVAGAGKLAEKFYEIPPMTQAQILESGVVPDDLPKSQYETAEKILELIQNKLAPSKGRDLKVQLPHTTEPRRPAIKPERISSGGKDSGLRPVPLAKDAPLVNQAGNVISPYIAKNTQKGGKAMMAAVQAEDTKVYDEVNKLYEASREANSNISASHPELVDALESRIAQYERIPDPSSIQKQIIRTSKKLVKSLRVKKPGRKTGLLDQRGNPIIEKPTVEYPEMDNQTLIDQVQSIRQIIDYDFAHGDSKNIFLPLIEDLQNAVLKTAESVGAEDAVATWQAAREAYRNWTTTFNNKYVRPYRNTTNKDYSKLYKKSQELDTGAVLKDILDKSKTGKPWMEASTREAVEQRLGKFLDNPKASEAAKFASELRELEALITPEQSQQIQQLFDKGLKPSKIKASKTNVTRDEKLAARYAKVEKPEQIQQMMNERTGIKQLREDLLDTQAGRDTFKRMAQQKVRSMLRGGNVEKDFTGNDMYKFLNNERNYELFSEILGDQEAEFLRQEAKTIGKKQMKKEFRQRRYSKIKEKLIMYKLIKTMLFPF